MKVLWFSNTPASGAEVINGQSPLRATGGWLYALNKAIENAVDLHIAFQHPYRLIPFRHGNTSFHPVYTGNILVQRLRERIGLLSQYGNMRKRYLKIIREVQPDVIHIHGSESPFLTILDATDIPVVISIQGNLTVCAHKYRTGFHGRHLYIPGTPISLRSLILGRRNYYRGLHMLHLSSAIERDNICNAQNIIGRTDWDRRITRILAPRSQYYVGQEILRDMFYSSEWQQPDISRIGKKSLFTTTGDSYYKGFETLCRALSLLNKCQVNVEWRVAGISDNSLIAKITRRELGSDYPEHGLTLLGSLAEHDLVEQMIQASVYVMPSHIENSSNSLCEAMLLGMPCIATFAGGTGSLLRDGEDGLLIQDGDPWAMAGAIKELLEEPDKASHYGAAARLRARERHNRENVVASLIQTYETILKTHQESIVT